jgi:hypothetical protein
MSGRRSSDHACGEERRIDHVVGLRRRILDVKVGHDSHLRADDGRLISFGPRPVKKPKPDGGHRWTAFANKACLRSQPPDRRVAASLSTPAIGSGRNCSEPTLQDDLPAAARRALMDEWQAVLTI